MPTLNVQSLLQDMLQAAKASLKDKWPSVRDLATSSLKKIAQSLVEIEIMKQDGTITEDQARLMVSMDKNTFKIVMLTIEGLGLLAVESALNAALNVIRDTVYTAIGFAIL